MTETRIDLSSAELDQLVKAVFAYLSLLSNVYGHATAASVNPLIRKLADAGTAIGRPPREGNMLPEWTDSLAQEVDRLRNAYHVYLATGQRPLCQ